MIRTPLNACVALALFLGTPAVAQTAEAATSATETGASGMSADAGVTSSLKMSVTSTDVETPDAGVTSAPAHAVAEQAPGPTGTPADGDTAPSADPNDPAPAALAPAAAASVPAMGETPPAAAEAASDSDAPLSEETDYGAYEETLVIAPKLDLKRIAGSAASVSDEELQAFEYQDISRIVEKVPGIYLRGEDGYGLRPNIGLRGANSDRSSKVTLMEDGVPLTPAPYSAPAAYYFPSTNRIVGVDIYKGPAAIRYGPQTIGGAVNLRTREVPEQTEGLVDVGMGSDAYGRVHGSFAQGGDGWGVLLEGIHMQTDGFKRLDGGGNTGFDKNEGMLKAKYRLRSGALRHTFELKLGMSNEESDETYLGLTDEDFARTPYRRYAASGLDHMSWLRTQAQLRWGVRFDAPVDVTFTAYRHDFSRAWRKLNRFADGTDPATVLAHPDSGRMAVYAAILRGEEESLEPDQALMIGTNDRRFVSQGLMAEGKWSPPGGVHLVRFGARAHYDRIERTHTEDPYQMLGGELVDSGLPELTTLRNRVSTLAGALWVVDEILWKRLLVTPGARVEFIQSRYRDLSGGPSGDSAYSVVLPSLGALYHLTDTVSVLAGVYRGFSPAVPGPTTEGASGTPAAVAAPEYSLNYEAGARWSREESSAELIGFFNDYSNMTGECSFSQGCPEDLLYRQTNAGRVHVYGLEAAGAWQRTLFADTQVRLTGAYTLTLSRFLTAFTSANPQFGEVEIGDALPYVPVHQANAGVGLVGTRWRVGASGTVVGQMRERAGQGEVDASEAVPAHAVLDLSAGWNVVEKSELYMVVENVLDSPYLLSRRPFGARPARPRFFHFGFRHAF